MTSAVDAVLTLLERDELFGPSVDARLASRGEHGLQLSEWRAQITLNEARRLPTGPDCLDQGDVFALPADGNDP